MFVPIKVDQVHFLCNRSDDRKGARLITQFNMSLGSNLLSNELLARFKARSCDLRRSTATLEALSVGSTSANKTTQTDAQRQVAFAATKQVVIYENKIKNSGLS